VNCDACISVHGLPCLLLSIKVDPMGSSHLIFMSIFWHHNDHIGGTGNGTSEIMSVRRMSVWENVIMRNFCHLCMSGCSWWKYLSGCFQLVWCCLLDQIMSFSFLGFFKCHHYQAYITNLVEPLISIRLFGSIQWFTNLI